MGSVKDQVTLITGASSGIGASTAVLFAKHGAKLALTGRNSENLQKVALECEKQGLPKDQILTVTGDVTNDDDVRRIVAATVEKFGTIHVLINNAGLGFGGSLQESTLDVLDYMYKLNVRSACHFSKLAIPYLKQTKGCIVNVSTLGTRTPSLGRMIFGYTMAKAALDMATQCLAVELAPDKIRVNSVNPGSIHTPVHARIIQNEADLQEYFRKIEGCIPLERMGQPDEVANAILFLASDGASYITGANVFVDGGLSHFGAWS